ncbi:hypothetical protein AAKU58_003667, partial [Oxalobacteraceae bacterium GrIS 1.18]
NDSAATSVKVGYRQAVLLKNPRQESGGGFCFGADQKLFDSTNTCYASFLDFINSSDDSMA